MKPFVLKPLPRPSRRSFVKRGLFGTAVLALGGAGLALRSSRVEPVPPEGLKVFAPHEYAVVVAIARRFILSKPGFPTPDEIGVGLAADRISAMTDITAQMELRQLLNLFENALTNLLFGGRVTPFTQLPPADQDRVLNEWLTSRLSIRRTGFMALRALVMAGYYANPKTWAATGYPGPPQGFHNAQAPVWFGGDQPRPPGNGVWSDQP